jgi:YVTN family beta-propeller protein
MKRYKSNALRVRCILLVIFLFYSFALFPQQIQAANAVTATITGFNAPCGVAVTPNSAYAYVTNEGGNTVSVINTATNTVTATVTVGSNPYGIALNSNGVYAYSVNTGSGTVSVINTATNTVIATVNVGYRPFRAAVTPNGAYAYVTNYGSNTVSVINTATNTVTATVNVGSYPYDVAFTPNGAYAYVTNQYGDTISVINTATNTVTATIPVGFDPFGAAFTPNGDYAYVTKYSSVSGGTNTVSVIATATNTVTTTITVGVNPSKVAVTPNGAYAYVTNQGDATVQSGTVSVINTATNTVTATIPVGNGPYDVAFTPNGAYSYVVNQYGNSVSVISTGTVSSAPTPTSAGLVGYWNMNEGSGNIAYDSSGYGNDGTITGAEWVQGISGSALKFSSDTTYVEMKRFPDGIGSNTQFTVSYWVKINKWPTAQYAYMVLFGTGTNGGYDGAFSVVLDNDPGFAPYGTVRPSFWNRHSYTTHTFTTGIWYDWTFVYDGKQIEMYQNGTFLENVGLAGANPNLNPSGGGWSSGTVWFSGPHPPPEDQYFDGILDEVKIYNYAQSDSEIQNAYLNTIGSPPALTTQPTSTPTTQPTSAPTTQSAFAPTTQPTSAQPTFAPTTARSDLISLPSPYYAYENSLAIDSYLHGYLNWVSQQTITTSAGQSINFNMTYQVFAPANPGERVQLFFVESWTPTWPPSDYTIPIYDGSPGVSPGQTMLQQVFFVAPSTPGTYYMWLCVDSQYSMQNAIYHKTVSMSGLPAHVKIIVSSLQPGSSFPIEIIYFALAAAIMVVIILLLVIVQRKKKKNIGQRIEKQSLSGQKQAKDAKYTGRVPTGYPMLDKLLYGGVPPTFSVALISPPCDERDALVKSYLYTGAKNGEITFYMTINPNFAKELAEQFPSNFYLFVCNPQGDAIVKSSANVSVIKGVENLTDISMLLNKTINKLDSPTKTCRRICIDLISDVMVYKGAVLTRKWLTEITQELKLEGFTTLAVIDPQMHPREDLFQILSVFEGEIDIEEKQLKKREWFLKIRRMSNQEYIRGETLLTEE